MSSKSAAASRIGTVGNGHAPPPSSGSIIGHWHGNEYDIRKGMCETNRESLCPK